MEINLRDRAKKVLPAGGFGNFDPSIFIEKAKGPYVFDSDGKKYIYLLISLKFHQLNLIYFLIHYKQV